MNKKIIKICIFNPSATPSDVLGGNGDAILDTICTMCEIDEHLETGEYYLDGIFLLDDECLWQHIQEESILKVTTDYGEEYFRIAKIQSTSRDISVFARQETIHQTLHMWLSDVRPEGQNGQGALSWIKDNSEGPKNITVLSDITKVSTAYYQDMNMYQALHDCDQSFYNRWGGEIQRRGYTLKINQKIGMHRGVQIRSNKNLTGFEANTNIDNVFTRLKPKGYDGITIDGYVDSPIISNYPFIKTTDPKYDDVKVKTEDNEEGYNTLAEAQAELIRRSELEFSQNHIDKIKADYRINFVQLEQTEEYKDYVQAERVFLGDEIDVYEEKHNINITVRAIRKRFDVLRQNTIEIELSNEVVRKKPPTIGDVLDKVENVENNINEKNKWFENAINNATDLINNGLKDSYVVNRKNEILIMDTTDINTATNVWRFNRGGLAHSKTGYYGTYDTAITQDGSIVATMITSGILNADLLKTGIIRNHNGDFVLNLDNGTIKFNGDKFKIVVEGQEENVATSSQLTQTEEKFEYKFANYRKPNLLSNSNPRGDNYSGWTLDGEGASFYPTHIYNWAGLKSTNTDTEVYVNSPVIKINNGGKYSVSFFIQKEQNVKSCEVHLIGSIDTNYGYNWYTSLSGKIEDNNFHRVNVTVDIPSNIKYLRFRVDNDGVIADSFYVVWFGEFMLIEGENIYPPTWYPANNELYNNIMSIDSEGWKVKHEDGSFTGATHRELYATNQDGIKTFSNRRGGLWGYNLTNGKSNYMIATTTADGGTGATVSTSKNNSNYFSIGSSDTFVNDEDIINTKSNIMFVYVPFGTTSAGTTIGTHILNNPLHSWVPSYFHNEAIFNHSIKILSNDENCPHSIFNTSESKVCIFGDNGVHLGFKKGLDNITSFKLTEQPGTTVGLIESWSNWDFKGYTLSNVNVTNTLEAQSVQLFRLLTDTKVINNLYGALSVNQDEFSYTVSEKQIIPYQDTELLIEIPQILAENMEFEYHINISKLSFGDYRIKEKNPYYFIVETDRVDSFEFTYQIVGKLLEKADVNNVVVANYSVDFSNNYDKEKEIEEVEDIAIDNPINQDLHE